MRLSRIFLAVIIALSTLSVAQAKIAISPLKHELTVSAGQSQSAIIKVTNEDDTPVTLYTSKEDFVSGDDSGTPKFVKPQEQTSDSYSLANWIKLENNNITLAKGETREIRFTVSVPKNGEPGGHYGAIFFSPGAPSGAQVAIVQRLGVLVLINVPGDIKIGGNLSGFDVGTKSWTVFTSQSGFHGFPIVFDTKFKNEGSTHLKPVGKITLTDEDGKVLENVGKESLSSPAGAFIGEKMVNYIPVNDGLGNVLPKSERRFESIWEGFGYTELQPDGTKAVKFKNLTDFYADQAAAKRAYLQFWESIHTRNVSKTITATLTLSYEWKDRVKTDFPEQSKKFTVQYTEQYVGLNYVVIALILIILAFAGYYVFVIVPESKERLRRELLASMEKDRTGGKEE